MQRIEFPDLENMTTFKNIYEFIIQNVPTIVFWYLFWIIIHFVASHLYLYMCVGSTFVGFLMSPFTSSAPHCQGLSWAIYALSRQFLLMWIALGTFIVSKLFKFV